MVAESPFCVYVCFPFQILKKPTDRNEILCILNVIKNLKLFKLYCTYCGMLGNKMVNAWNGDAQRTVGARPGVFGVEAQHKHGDTSVVTFKFDKCANLCCYYWQTLMQRESEFQHLGLRAGSSSLGGGDCLFGSLVCQFAHEYKTLTYWITVRL
jgi:hypothetical protein